MAVQTTDLVAPVMTPPTPPTDPAADFLTISATTPTGVAPHDSGSYPFPDRRTDADTGGRLWNWADNAVLGRSDAVASPTTEEELQAVVVGSRGRLRLVGSRMSAGRMLEVSTGEDLLVDVSGLRGHLASTPETATFAGGTLLSEVYEVLTAEGRELPASPGVIASQTLAGALATGTHGQGLGQSSISDAVESLRLVLADGTLLEVDRDHAWFPAVQLGLGALGVVTRVTLRTRPSTVWTCIKDAVGAGDLERDVLAWNREHALAKAWWFPAEDKVHVWTADEASAADVQRYEDGGRELVEHTGASDAMNATVDTTLAHMRSDTKIVDEHGKPFRTVSRFKDFTDVTGDIYQVFCRGIATPQINVEIGVPLDRAPAVVSAIREWFAATRPHMHYPIILRATGPSTAWLSPSHEQDTLFFGFVVYYSEDGTLSADGVEFLRDVEQLLAAHGGRPHWGKYFDSSLYDWPALYPHWEDFRTVRATLDPDHRFGNAFTTGLLDR